MCHWKWQAVTETGGDCGGLEGPQRTGRACGGGGREEEEEVDDDYDESLSQNIYIFLYRVSHSLLNPAFL